MNSEAGLPYAALQTIVENLLVTTGASRTTLRLDRPDWNLRLEDVAAEATAPGITSLKGGRVAADLRQTDSVRYLEEHRDILVQDDCLTAEDAPPPELLRLYGVRAQMLGPVVKDGGLIGIISVHWNGGVRQWSEADRTALEAALAMVRRELG